MIGIKGTGMSALAVNLKTMAIEVTGSDYSETFFTDDFLKKQGIKVLSPFSPKNIPARTDLVVVSTAYNNKNVEWQEAEKRGLEVVTYPEMLGRITHELSSIAICGSHGKTTTTGALSYLLSKTSYQPIVNVGSIVPQLLNYRSKHPKLFVFEADEYQNKFRYFEPRIVILTNINYDHPDFFRNPYDYKLTFKNFIKKIPRDGLLIYCADDADASDVAKETHCRKISYGFSKSAQLKIVVQNILPSKMNFSVSETGNPVIKFTSKLIGNHNALNLTAVAACAKYLKLPVGKIQKSIANFVGTQRRLEVKKKTTINGQPCIIIDDFGHHPTEIREIIATIKKAYPEMILWTVFQPHTFSRTEALFDDFTKAFKQSDKTIILDIYASKRETVGKISSRDLVNEIDSPDVFYEPDIKSAAQFLKKEIKKPSVILTLGASEVWRLVELL